MLAEKLEELGGWGLDSLETSFCNGYGTFVRPAECYYPVLFALRCVDLLYLNNSKFLVYMVGCECHGHLNVGI